MIGRVGSLRIYCMRGTRRMIDIVMDLKAVPKPLGPGTVHKGFYDRMDMVIREFPLDNSITRVLVTGHSLGGGAAHCGYLMLKTLYPAIPVVCVTFGVPCCVSPEIMMAIEEPREIVNFIDEGDYIPFITIDKYTSANRTKESRIGQILGMMKSDTSLEESKLQFKDLFCAYEVISTTIQELCHYHPMGVYYYVRFLVVYDCSYHYLFLILLSTRFGVEMRNISSICLIRSTVESYQSLLIIWSNHIRNV